MRGAWGADLHKLADEKFQVDEKFLVDDEHDPASLQEPEEKVCGRRARVARVCAMPGTDSERAVSSCTFFAVSSNPRRRLKPNKRKGSSKTQPQPTRPLPQRTFGVNPVGLRR
eukprot:1574483-Rhodomonas_salina.1